MTDYVQELDSPEYRNLVINPSGEISVAATWFGSSGTVVTGSTGTTPVSGTGVVAYTVSSQVSSLPYYFAPIGPQEDVHRGAFKIPRSQTLSSRISLRSSATVWITLQAAFYVFDGIGLTNIATRSLSLTPVQLTGGAGWQTLESFDNSTTIPSGASHWRLLVSVSGSNPADPTPTAPAAGVVVYADRAMVTDSGANLSGVAYVDGSQAGAYWEGVEHYSSSRTGTVVVDPAMEAVAQPAISTEETTLGPPPSDTFISSPQPPEPPIPVPAAPYQRSSEDIAREIIGWQVVPQSLCLKSDVQIGNLRLNTIDSEGVVWIVSDIEGWWTLPEPDVPDLSRAWFDGSFQTRGRYTPRVFTLTGSFIPNHPNSVPSARDRLIRAIDLCHHGDWFITHEDATELRSDTKGSLVWLSGQPLINTVNAKGRTDFSIGLRAPDPIKYKLKSGAPPGYETMTLTANNVDYPGRAYSRKYPWAYPEALFGMTESNAVNHGNAVVAPKFVLNGPTFGAVVIHNSDTNQQLRVTKKLNAGEKLVIDCFTKSVSLNGAGNYRFYLDIDVDWIMLQPGANKLFFAEESPNASRTTLDVTWRSGWIG